METLEGLDTRLLVDLLRDRVSPSKSLGQHYLVDDEVIERSIHLTEEFDCPLSRSSHVLEVGPGPGSLTLALLRSESTVTAIEIDKQSVEHLRRVFRESAQYLTIDEADAVSGRWPKGITHVISNLPYQISSPIIDRITKYHSSVPIQLSILLVQEEFAHRMAMSSAPYDIGPLGLNLWLDFDVFPRQEGLTKLIQPIPARAIQDCRPKAGKQARGRRDKQAAVQNNHQTLLLEQEEENEDTTIKTTV